MQELSTKEYNELYKKYFKEIFSKPMKELDFKKKGTGKFCRMNSIGLFEYIGFFRYYRELRVEYAIIPIYSNVLKDAISNGSSIEFEDLDGKEKMEKGMKKILNKVKNEIIPWFKKYEDVDIFLTEIVENLNIFQGVKIYEYLFRAITFAKFKKYLKIQENIEKVREEYKKLTEIQKKYDFFIETLREAETLEKKIKEGEKILEKYINDTEYNSLLYWKMERLLKNRDLK